MIFKGKTYAKPYVNGGLAQLGEHLLCKQGVVGSIPSSSTKKLKRKSLDLGLIFSRSIAVSFFNNLEEVKFYVNPCNNGLAG